jgi:hypothetical protein
MGLENKNNDKNELPAVAGGAPQPSERLRAASQHMEPPEAKAAERIAQAWQQMSPAEYEAFARSL